MKICFATLGCPAWDLDTICARGREYGFDGVDFRGYLDTLDITLLPQFTTHVAQTRRQINSAGLEVSGISSSITLCVPELRERNLEEARRTIATAAGLGAKNVRVFGGGDLSLFTRSELVVIAQDCLSAILNLDGAREVKWLFETHDNWIHSRDCKLMLDQNLDPAFGVLWDMGHTPRVGGEMPEETYQILGPRIGYTHIKDAVYEPGGPCSMEDGWRYVIPGTGQVPIARAILTLKEHGYTGWLQFEHEKRWHPKLQEPEVIFPEFSRWVKKLL